MKKSIQFCFKWSVLLSFLLLFSTIVFAVDSDFPDPPNPPRLVNDFGGFLTPDQDQSLEYSLDSFNKVTSIEITIVTLKSLGQYDASSYAFELGNKWGVGRSGKNNGVLILASMDDRKLFIATGYGMEGALPDILLGRIYRNEMTPEFKKGDYYQGFRKAINAIFKASKGEYKAEPQEDNEGSGWGGLIIVILIIVFIIYIISKRGGGGGNYMSRRGSDFITGAILGSMFNGGGSGWSGGGGFGGGGGGGFGGFGGGSFGGGGAGGSW